MVELISTRTINRIVARQTRPAVGEEAIELGVRAEANLARHRDDGTHRVTVDQPKIDAFVRLEGEAPLSVEMGHFTGYKRRRYVPGLRVLQDAAGL